MELDHLILAVNDHDASVAFSTEILGLTSAATSRRLGARCAAWRRFWHRRRHRHPNGAPRDRCAAPPQLRQAVDRLGLYRFPGHTISTRRARAAVPAGPGAARARRR